MKAVEPDISAYSPEKTMWAGVVEQAIHDLGNSSALIRDSAIDWFKNRTRDGVGSFVWICFILNLDPDKTTLKVLGGR